MIVLDTHTWLWWTNESINLSGRADEAIDIIWVDAQLPPTLAAWIVETFGVVVEISG